MNRRVVIRINMDRAVDPRTLRSFVAVAREGNVSRAASALHLTQTAISLQMKRLTESTGLTLFVRTAKGVGLTQDGTALLVEAEQVAAISMPAISSAARWTAPWTAGPEKGRIDPAFRHAVPTGSKCRAVAPAGWKNRTSGLGWNPLAPNEAQVRGRVVVDGAAVETTLGFPSFENRRAAPRIALAFDPVAGIWGVEKAGQARHP